MLTGFFCLKVLVWNLDPLSSPFEADALPDADLPLVALFLPDGVICPLAWVKCSSDWDDNIHQKSKAHDQIKPKPKHFQLLAQDVL